MTLPRSANSGNRMNIMSGAGMNRYLDLFGPLSGQKDIAFAGAVCLVLAILFVPLPPILMDIGLALSFAISILILMVALWVKKPLHFNSFPTVLLIVTVMRLALSVASTRLILANGNSGTDAAGHVIEGIAYFVVGGDFIIGTIVFAILVAINFIVITKGSTRIAEVSARFSLDAMPGKQMAIDAELGTGTIDEDEARRRRKEVEGESSFFGAMDGAAKFVKGDAIAGIIITMINILGGLLIGTLRHDMAFMDALQTFTVLTIGDGLVTQIPALIVSIAAGMIVTKGSMEGSASDAVVSQLGASPKALYVAAALVGGLGLLPGFPMLIFFPIAAILATMGLIGERQIEAQAQADEQEARRKAAFPTEEEKDPNGLGIDTICLDLGSSLIMMVGDAEAALPGKINSLRKLFAEDFGIVLPKIRIKDETALSAGEYRISIQGIPVASGDIVVGSRLLIDPTGEATNNPARFPGVRVKEPTFGLSAIWVEASRSTDYEAMGYTVVDTESVIITHLTEIIREHMPDMLSYGETLYLHENLDRNYQKLITDLPNPAPIILLQNVLQNLLKERVSIRNLQLIAEAMAEAAPLTKSPTRITEHVRSKLSAQICHNLTDTSGFIPFFKLGPNWEREFVSSVKMQGDEATCVMTPQRVEEFVKSCRIMIQKFSAQDEWPAVLVNPDYRPIIRSMLERISPLTQVISHSEINRHAKLRCVGSIGD